MVSVGLGRLGHGQHKIQQVVIIGEDEFHIWKLNDREVHTRTQF